VHFDRLQQKNICLFLHCDRPRYISYSECGMLSSHNWRWLQPARKLAIPPPLSPPPGQNYFRHFYVKKCYGRLEREWIQVENMSVFRKGGLTVNFTKAGTGVSGPYPPLHSQKGKERYRICNEFKDREKQGFRSGFKLDPHFLSPLIRIRTRMVWSPWIWIRIWIRILIRIKSSLSLFFTYETKFFFTKSSPGSGIHNCLTL